MPKISIVLPTYNGSRYLDESIQSCLNQSYSNIELIVVDDGSTNSLTNVVNKYNDPRLRYIRKENNSGLPDTLNAGFKVSNGDYLTWTSDDNIYHKDAIKIMCERLNNDSEIMLVYCNYNLIDEEGAIKETVFTGKPEDLYSYNCIGPCFLYRRKIFETIGDYDGNCILVEDYDYWLRIWKYFKMVRIDNSLYFFRLHQSSLTGKHGGTDFLHEQVAMVKRKNLSKSMYFLSRSRELFVKNNMAESIKYACLSICCNLTNVNSWKLLLRILKR
jgi:glycosyltransferase involved in cell wall biosynthesis